MRQLIILFLGLFLAGSTFSQKGFTENPLTYQPTPKTYQKVNIDLGSSPTAELVRSAILEKLPWLSQKGFDLSLDYERESPYSFHFTYHQVRNGVPIYHHNIKANVGPQGKIYSFLNNLLDIEAAPQGGFAQSESAAITLIAQQYQIPEPVLEADLKRCYFPVDGQLIPAYQIQYNYGESRWESLLDASLLTTLSRRDLASYRHRFMATGDTTGTGMVFNPDPLTSSGNTYGSTSDWMDNNDADNAALNGQRVQVTLKDICYIGGAFHLKGPYVDLQDVESPTSPVATSTDGVFNFTRSQQGFEDVMCYYHIDTFQRYIQSMGFTNIFNAPLICDPHGLNGTDQSHFVPQGTTARIAFGEGCVDDAEDADVIIHEYGHALSWSAAPNSNGGTERQGLDEGIGDYLATSYSRATSYNFWKNMFTWDGHNDCWDGRTASTNMTYPLTSGFDIYDYGEIWNTCLMEVYDQIGKESNDQVVFQSLYGNNLNMTLTDAARIVIEADSVVFGGAHTAQYQMAFCNRGLLSGGECIVSRVDPNLERPSWKLFPNPTSTQVNVQFTATPGRNQYQYDLTNLLGQVIQKGNLNPSLTQIEIGNLNPGIYLVNILNKEGQVVGTRKLSVTQ